MEELKELKREIEKIKERNARVEADKARETSLAICIADGKKIKWDDREVVKQELEKL